MSESERIDAFGTTSGEEISAGPGIGADSIGPGIGGDVTRIDRDAAGIDRDAAGIDDRGQDLARERLTPRRHAPRPSVTDQLLGTGQFVECIFSCPACGLSGTSIARPAMLEGKTCMACGELVSVTVV